MASTTGDLDRLSGVALPLILQRKLHSQQQASQDGNHNSKNKKNDDNDTLQPAEEDDGRSNVVFTAEELEERVWKARSAMADIQKQLIWDELEERLWNLRSAIADILKQR